MLAMISVSAGYGTDGSNTPTTVAVRDPNDPSLTTFPSTVGSLFSAVVQKRYVRTTAPAAAGPSSLEIQSVVDLAHSAPPEVAADALIRVAALDQLAKARRVELLEQAFAHCVAASIATDVLAHQEHPLIAQQRLAQTLAQGLAIIDAHGGAHADPAFGARCSRV